MAAMKMESAFQVRLRDERGAMVAVVWSEPHAHLFAAAEEMRDTLRMVADALPTSKEPWAPAVLRAVLAAIPPEMMPPAEKATRAA